MKTPFAKMQCNGNDFVVLDLCRNDIVSESIDVKTLGHRNIGIGFDQLLVIQPPRNAMADFSLGIFNSDGTEAEQCGNGSACVAKYVYENDLAIKRDNTFETAGGMVETETNADPSGTVQTVRVGVGIPSTDLESIPFNPLTLRKNPRRINYVITLSDLTWWTVTPVSMGNPHLVIFVDDVDGADVPGIGSRVQKHHTLPNSCNVEFVQVEDRRHMKMRVYERGAGETLACGSGACAATVAAILNSHIDNEVEISQPGGSVKVGWEGTGTYTFLTCKPQLVFEGEL